MKNLVEDEIDLMQDIQIQADFDDSEVESNNSNETT